jgi:hypothetical protein
MVYKSSNWATFDWDGELWTGRPFVNYRIQVDDMEGKDEDHFIYYMSFALRIVLQRMIIMRVDTSRWNEGEQEKLAKFLYKRHEQLMKMHAELQEFVQFRPGMGDLYFDAMKDFSALTSLSH